MRRRRTSPARLAWNFLIRLCSALCSTAPTRMRRRMPAITTRLTSRIGPSPRGESDPAFPSLLPTASPGAAGSGSSAYLVVVCDRDNLAEPGKLVAAVECGGGIHKDPGLHRDGPAVFALARFVRHYKSGRWLGPDVSAVARPRICGL